MDWRRPCRPASSDGDLDLFFGRNPGGTTAFYYQNLRLDDADQPEHSWLRVKLGIPNGSAPWPVTGTLVRLEQPPGTPLASQVVDEGKGHVGLSSADLTFGLGLGSVDVRLVVIWPDGKQKTTTISQEAFNAHATRW